MTQDPKTYPKPPPNQIALNWADWLPWLEDEEASLADKKQLIEVIWFISQAFVDLGWEVTSESCGEVPDLTQALRQAVLNTTETQKEEV